MTTPERGPGQIQASADARIAGIVLIAASLLSILMMAHHPSVETHDSTAIAGEIAGKAQLSRIVHGVLIALIGAQLFAFSVFCDRIGAARSAVRAGFVAYAIGIGAMIGAALISGFVVSDLALHYAQPPSGAATPFVDLLRLCMTGNQALANLGTVAMSTAIVLWSIALFGARENRWVAIVGLIAGLAPAIALMVGAIRLDVGGMTLVVVCQAVWIVAVGAQLIRSKI